MNLNIIIWNRWSKVENSLNKIDESILAIENKITNLKKLKFNVYYIFREFDKLNINQQWKELILARQIVKFTKHWDRKYLISMNDNVSTLYFIEFFKNQINPSHFNMKQTGIPYYLNNYRTTVKTMITWANKLSRLQIIGKIKLNQFLTQLENDYPVWLEDIKINKRTKFFKNAWQNKNDNI